MNKQFHKYLDDVLWWCPFKKLRYLIREYLNKIEDIEKENKQIINHLNIITNKIFPENKNVAVISIDGGFVDQIRMYLVAKSLEKIYNKKILFDISWYKTNGMDCSKNHKRYFELTNIFKDIEFNLATEDQIFIAKNNNNIDCWYKSNNAEGLKSLLNELNEEKPIYLYNVMSLSIKSKIEKETKINIHDTFKILNFKDVIPSLDKYFIPILDEKNREIYNDIINSKNTVACHIRRTDYVGYYGYVDLNFDYYKNAFETIEKKINNKIKIFFFSDDIDWVNENIIPNIKNIYDYKIVDINSNEKGYFDFYLISKCNHQISSSGCFCQVAHQFNEFNDKILIVPKSITYLI
ncbi:alpha-1,2-fucosyltransferase [uncultured Brachyspira sp.]|uniref:alpha-1,2-fucosyltransferase n=1 Tax=uncultured Brachyspira sp. TaxID=221953 RepID=UPI00259A929A|nr:alpha-1,2-fucosyltransferase [uncultured Brachyspira sp.]